MTFKAFKNNITKYYKFGTNINPTVVGTLTNNNGVISGFSSSNYLKSAIIIPQSGINNFNIIIKVTTDSSIENYMTVICPSKTGTHNNNFQIQVSGTQDKIQLLLYDEDEYVGLIAKEGISTNTTYWCKWFYNGTNVYTYYSLDGETYTLNDTVEVTTQIENAFSKFISDNIRIGCDMSGYNPFIGSIDLSKSRIIINGKLVWSGTNLIEIPFEENDSILSNPDRIRKYYKYKIFQQPILNSNRIMGGDSFACTQSAYHIAENYDTFAYGMFNTSNKHWQINSISSQAINPPYIEWYNPYPIITSSLIIKNHTANNYVVKDYVLYGSNNRTNWEELASGTNDITTKNSEWSIVIPNAKQIPYKYFKMTCTANDNTSIMINRLTINATYSEYSSISDYDYAIDEIIDYSISTYDYKLFKDSEIEYYKNLQFERPFLSDNGTMGGDSFACTQSEYYTEQDGTERKAWRAFNKISENDRWQINNVNLNDYYSIMWYNPQPFSLSIMMIRNSTSANYVVKDYVLYGSNDGINYDELVSGTNSVLTANGYWYIYVPQDKQKFYKYYDLKCKPNSTTSMMIAYINFDGSYETSGTSSDYDYSKETNITFEAFNN